jgi:6-phospho-beta-glucosidase
MRFVVLGGSATSTPELLEALDGWPIDIDRRPELTVILVGRSTERLELVARACRTRVSGKGRPLVVETDTDQRRALTGADVVLSQVRIGGLAARSFDESFAWEFGLPGEETMGPGGFANAMRTIPAVRTAWADIAAVAPDAFVVCLTNPSGMVLQAARREFPICIVEVCDGPITFLEGIAARLDRSAAQVRRRYVGMNHFGWYVPETADELETIVDLAPGVDTGMVHLFGALPLPYVRYQVHPDRMLAAQRGKATRAQALLELQGRMLDVYRTLESGSDMPRRGAVWYAKSVVPLIDAWLNGSPETLLVGVPGRGLVPGLAPEVVVEIPHVAPRPGVPDPLVPVGLPPLAAALLARQGAYEALAVDAALSGDHERRLRALVASPMVGSYDQAVGLLEAIERRGTME